MSRYAVIDLGTNTFHLLIAEEGPSGKIKEVFRERRFVKLAEEGIDAIGEQPYRRGLETLQRFRRILAAHAVPVEQVRVFGTAALRTASNGPAFIREVQESTGIEIRLISGDREAELIYKGVIMAVPPTEERMLIMDIGGGSVEFIIADYTGVLWAQSFPAGVAVLYKNFHRHEPILPQEVDAIHLFLQQQLAPLLDALGRFPTQRLVGASGTFDVMEFFLGEEKAHPLNATISAEKFLPFYEQLVKMDEHQRRNLPGMPLDRVDMIVVALILIEVVLKMAGIRQITVSAYAMKEGMLYEMMRK
ncbi:MAG: Ppx/GppA family phosphatase [Lewinellaceae bacterium]|nr:Ppx/GppA family phosphatase [Phaeodactylibacter sp.]MCB9037365.1 Ppx/GppA family phosphatase [Lewinellaceae bacterium]